MARLARRPLERFLRIEAGSGALLLVATAAALVWANSPWSESYSALWHTPLGIRIGGFDFERTLEWLVNDALMVIFFFVVGLEIRREIHHGELAELRRASLPAAAALGGMIVPACIYLLFAHDRSTATGWGVPMATDIAFAVGVLALLGRRVPPALRVLLLTLAVIDDLGAIIVIAIFYSAGVSWGALAVAAGGLVLVLVMQRFGVRSKFAYILPGVVAWAGVYAAGVHPTIAGVIVGLMTPVRAWLGPAGFIFEVQRDIESIVQAGPERVSSHELSATLSHVDAARREAMSPAEHLIETLHPWVAFGIMPIFALANAGVSLAGAPLDESAVRVALGSALGLFLGKPVGVMIACFLALKLRLSTLPRGITARHLVLLGIVAGIGFTMSLFIAHLAFSDHQLLGAAKLGVLIASFAAGVLALALGRFLLRVHFVEGAAASADEAESSTEQ